MSGQLPVEDRVLLRKLNRASWRESFCPDGDVDWSATTTPAEFRDLYDAWSLLRGSSHDAALDEPGRIEFARYQQWNLMLFTALFERFAIPNLESLLGNLPDPELEEYIAHMVKEETYHYVLFQRAIAQIREAAPPMDPLPQRHVAAFLVVSMALLRWFPLRRLRIGIFFHFLRFAEEITLQAHAMTRRVLPRRDSLVSTVWALHARDEARHVAFDDLMMRRSRLPAPWERLPALLATPLCMTASLLLNLNEVWAARRLGLRVGYHELPLLMMRTTSPFKRRVFGLLGRSLRGSQRRVP